MSIKIDLDEFIDRLQMSHKQRRAWAADACFEGSSDAADFPLSLMKIPQRSNSEWTGGKESLEAVHVFVAVDLDPRSCPCEAICNEYE